MNKRLCLQTLDALPDFVVRPKYTMNEHKAGIVHIGIGAFHRGHQAVFTDDAIANSGGDWRITGVSLRSGDVAEQMNPQNGLFTVSAKFNQQQEIRLIGAVERVLVAPENPQAVVSLLASPNTKVVTLSVTEKGYHYHFSKHALIVENADIQHDIAHPLKPVSMPGFIVAACLARMQNKHEQAKLSVISCDNLPHNGEVTRKVVTDLAKCHSQALVDWIAQNLSFSSSMVDRIVPAVTESDRDALALRLGMRDNAMIQTETFKQWVIEDNFCTPIPDWKSAGVLLVNNVEQYEKLKLRTLNGSHSGLAYMGVLLGYKWIHEAVNAPILLTAIKRLMKEETGPSLQCPDGFDLSAYQAQILARFGNDQIAYATQQVAMDGSQKLMQRIFAPISDNLSTNDYGPEGTPNNTVLISVIASWLIYLRGKDEAGNTFDIKDPIAKVLTGMASKYQYSARDYVNALILQTDIVPQNLHQNTAFTESLVRAITQIDTLGLAKYLDNILHG